MTTKTYEDGCTAGDDGAWGGLCDEGGFMMNNQKIVEIGTRSLIDNDGYSYDAEVHAALLNDQYSWASQDRISRYQRLMQATIAALKAEGFYICRLDDEIIAKSIVTKCVVDELAVQPMPDEVAYALAQAVIETLKGCVMTKEREEAEFAEYARSTGYDAHQHSEFIYEAAFKAWCAARATIPASPVVDDSSLRGIVNAQAEDEGLWFQAQYASEAYLQQELRRLHAAIELRELPTQPAVQLSDWQDIESAPKGEMVLIYVPNMYDTPYFIAHFSTFESEKGYWRVGGSTARIGKDLPTHWQPLPAPPQQAIKSRGGAL